MRPEWLPHVIHAGQCHGGAARRDVEHALFVDDRGHLRPKRTRCGQQRPIERFESFHLGPQLRIVKPAAGAEVHPPRREVPHGTLSRVAQQFRLRFPPESRRGRSPSLSRSSRFARRLRTATSCRPRRRSRRLSWPGALAHASIEVRNRRAEDIDIGAVEHASQGVVARRARPVGHRTELEQVAVEEHDQFAALRGLSHGTGQLADAVGHRLLLELGEVDHLSFRLEIAKDAGRSGTPLCRAGHFGRRRASLGGSCHARRKASSSCSGSAANCAKLCRSPSA